MMVPEDFCRSIVKIEVAEKEKKKNNNDNRHAIAVVGLT